ncbi:hypothetical protein [Dyella sp. 2YAF14]|uniref:hypothetical protein n=1 Tax=Dyella sp. 2YAF14 TaxID=3233025 RepID=UPI003F90B55A
MPRLRKGELAVGISARAERSRQNAHRRLEVFARIQASPPDTAMLKSHFLTISALASWTDEALGIAPISQKTLRKYVDKEYRGGYTSLRSDIQALLVPHDELAEGLATKEATSHRKTLAARADSVMDMSAQYLDLLQRIKRIATYDSRIESELTRHFERFSRERRYLKAVP